MSNFICEKYVCIFTPKKQQKNQCRYYTNLQIQVCELPGNGNILFIGPELLEAQFNKRSRKAQSTRFSCIVVGNVCTWDAVKREEAIDWAIQCFDWQSANRTIGSEFIYQCLENVTRTPGANEINEVLEYLLHKNIQIKHSFLSFRGHRFVMVLLVLLSDLVSQQIIVDSKFKTCEEWFAVICIELKKPATLRCKFVCTVKLTLTNSIVLAGDNQIGLTKHILNNRNISDHLDQVWEFVGEMPKDCVCQRQNIWSILQACLPPLK